MRYLESESGVTLKTRLGFVQGHWKWHHLIDRIRVPIRLHSNYGDILYRLRDILVANFYTPPVFSTPAGVQNFVKMFDADKTRMIGLPYG